MTDRSVKEFKLPKALKSYKTMDFAKQQKARFIFYMTIAAVAAMFIIISSSIYIQLIRDEHPGLYAPVIHIELTLLFIFLVSLYLLIRGSYGLATHLFMSAAIISVWVIMWIDKGHYLTRLDTIILIVALLNMTPLFITRYKISILVYIIVNIGLLFFFMFFWSGPMDLPLSASIDYVIDTGLAIVFTGILGYNIFDINKKTIDRALLEIKERKSSEEKLKENELFRSRVFDSSRIGIVVMDGHTYEFVDCNTAAVNMYQFNSREDTLGKTPFDVSAPVQPDGTASENRVRDYIEKALKEDRVIFEWLHKRPSGELWDAEVHLIGFSSGGREFFQFSLIDITERKMAENQLRESEEKYRFLMENMNEAVMMVDNDDRVLFVNKKFTELLGYTIDEIVGKIGYELLLHPGDHQLILEENRKRKEKAINQYELCFIAKNGRKIDFLINGSPIVDSNDITIGSIGTMTDITERKQTELVLEKYRNHLESLVKERTEELAATNEELSAINEELLDQKEELRSSLNELHETQNRLIHSEKMASLGILSAGIAHEINNPLNFIQGGAAGLENYLREKFTGNYQDIEVFLNAIEVGVNRASEIVTSLSHYSRQDSLPVDDCNIHRIIDHCLIMLQNRLKNRVILKKTYTGELNTIKGNEGKLHQAFLNILSNAEQAIPESGLIEIKTEIIKDDMQIEICDTGIGISKTYLSKVFDPFFTTKAPGKGTGLGLAITYKIIREHHGSIEMESSPGKGTKVKIKLPVSESITEPDAKVIT